MAKRSTKKPPSSRALQQARSVGMARRDSHRGAAQLDWERAPWSYGMSSCDAALTVRIPLFLLGFS